MGAGSRPVGRPRKFDETDVIDHSLDVFWRHGWTDTTTRTLETELGLTQSSIYNAFGSKSALLDRALDRYLSLIDATVVSQLDADDAGLDTIVGFIDDLLDWVSQPSHPGCLMLNLLAERPTGPVDLQRRAESYRSRLRDALVAILVRADGERAVPRANLLVAGVMGMNIAARGGADGAELEALADGLRDAVRSWA